MKIRLDRYLTENGLADVRSKAQALIMSGVVYINEQKADKVGIQVAEGDHVEVRGGLAYVSRGGLKLEKALECFELNLSGKICMDVGASTGGFTDCMLQNGAETVYSIDVGYGQLAWSLRTNPKVVNMERTNIRFVMREDIGAMPQFATVDVSFISLKLIFPVLSELLTDDGSCVCLIKPQFEAGREKVGKNGVVRDPAVHAEVIGNVIHFARGFEFSVCGLDYSPVKGPKGNIEYLLYVCKSVENNEFDIKSIVEEAHANAK